MKKVLFSILGCSFFTCANCADIAFINSDNTKYSKENVLCSGNVIIVYCNRVISADKISYDKTNDVIHANGNVIIKDERQNVYFIDSLSVSKNFDSGNAKNIKIIMDDKSRLAADTCVIKKGKFELTNVIYTPCYECSESGELTWQVKSSFVVFDPEKYTHYQDAKFELFGTPIFYTPYLSHVSPKIKRKSGFLVPRFSTSGKNGFSVLPKYLCSISDSQELILKPIITSKIGSVGWAYYGIRFPNGEFNVDASITGTKSVNNAIGEDAIEKKAIKKIQDSGYRGHVFSKMRYEINDIWRCGFDINLASDRYYLKRFPFFQDVDRVLESNAKVEGFDGRNYTLVKTAMFQGEPSSYIPRILPLIERNYSHDLFSGTFNLDSSFMNLDFNNNRSAQKVVSNAQWGKKLLLPFGNIFDVKGTLSFRGLKVSERQHSEYDSSFIVLPQLRCAWQWPLVFSSNFMNTIFTPIAGIIIASNRKCDDIFEDQFSEINALSLFEGNHSISTYNIDSGNRIFYGAKLAGYKNGENLYRFAVGKSTELADVRERLEASGLKHKHSNIVSSLDVMLSDEWTFSANGSYSPKAKNWSRIETGLNFTNKDFTFDIFAFNGKQCFYDPFYTRLSTLSEEQKTQKYKGIMLDFGLRMTDTLKFKSGVVIGNKQDTLAEKSDDASYKLVKHHVGLTYKNECTEVDFTVERRNYRSGDLKPDTSFRFVVHLKNLGI